MQVKADEARVATDTYFEVRADLPSPSKQNAEKSLYQFFQRYDGQHEWYQRHKRGGNEANYRLGGDGHNVHRAHYVEARAPSV